MTLQNLRSGQKSFLYSLARETTRTPFTTNYLSKHYLGSLGGVQAAIKKLMALDYIEKKEEIWQIVDPMFSLWLKNKEKTE